MYIDLSKVIKALIRTDSEWTAYIVRRSEDIKEYYHKAGFKKAVIGLSGGIDSAVSAALAVRALGAKNVLAYSLPYSDTLHKDSSNVAQQIADSLGVQLKTIPISKIVESLLELNVSNIGNSDLSKGNACARARMMVLMHAATLEHGLVLGTENRTEEILAYYTIGGDDTTHVEPIHDLYKVQIFQLAKTLRLPESVLNRAPSAELWEGQTDEEEIGANYEHIDNVLYILEDMRKPDLLDDSPMTKSIIDRVNKAAGKRNCPNKL